jgi:hypothetical protein
LNSGISYGIAHCYHRVTSDHLLGRTARKVFANT